MIIFKPIWPWSYIAAITALLTAVLLLLRGALDYKQGESPWRRLGGNKRTRIAALLLSIMAAAFLSIAAINPFWMNTQGTGGFHLQAAVDVSDSVLRARGGWETVKNRSVEKIDSSVEAIQSDLLSKCTGGILTFRDNTNNAWGQKPLKGLPEALNKLDNSMFASGEGTNIESALNTAASLIEKSGGQGAVILISDGNQTTGDALSSAQQLSRQGIPVHVIPITSQSPAVAITDANLPRQIHTNVQTYVRGVTLNHLNVDKEADLTLSKDPGGFGESKTPGERSIVSKHVSLPTDRWVRFRWPVVFDEFGIQFIDLTLNTMDGNEPRHHLRRFFTYVKRPPQILSIGGDNAWMEAIPGDAAKIIPIDPKEPIDREKLKNVDAVVINGVPSSQLPKESMNAIAEAVEKRGTGLMLINGGHPGADEKAETVLMSYKNTSIERLLPVKGGPRPFMEEPPSRQLAILIDTSGSMDGWKLQKSKEIAKHIVSNLLRKQDRLDLISFTTGVGKLLEDRYMDDEGKRKAIRLIDSIESWGGTDPKQALELIGNKKMEECGLIFISDGEFGYIDYRPDCRVTVLEIGSDRYSQSEALQKFADPIPVGLYFDPKAITIPYFEPQQRTKFFEKGEFTPQSMEKHLPQNQRLPVPELELNGSAVCYLKEGGILNGVRPKLTDPVLAFGESGAGYVGVFTSEIPRNWLNVTEGRKAIEAWICRLVPFMDRNRYDFKLDDRGDVIDICVSLVAKSGKIPNVTGMNANIDFPGKESVGIVLQADEASPGTFNGQIRVNRTENTRRGVLILREFGSEAAPRIQRIPILIPPKGNIALSSKAEAYSCGQNRELLQKIAEAGGGMFDPPKDAPFFKEKPASSHGKSLWEFFAVIAAFLYLTAIAVKRINPPFIS